MRTVEVTSPDGQIRYAVRLTDSLPEYTVTFRGVILIDHSPLGLTFLETGAFGRGLTLLQPVYREGEDKYDLVVGKTKSVHDFYREAEIPLEERAGRRRRVNLLVRVFNDGVAFRWELPGQSNWSSYSLTDENSSFRLAGDPVVLASFLPGFTTSHEGRYTRQPFHQIKSDTLMDMPVFIEFPGHIYAAITEAQLVD